MKLIYSDHAKKRKKQRGIIDYDIEHVLKYPMYIKKSFEGRKEAVAEVRNRLIKVSIY